MIFFFLNSNRGPFGSSGPNLSLVKINPLKKKEKTFFFGFLFFTQVPWTNPVPLIGLSPIRSYMNS